MTDLAPVAVRPHRPVTHTLADLADRLGVTASGPIPAGDTADRVVTGVTLDSRAVVPGDLYAALPGQRTHGGRFARQARGAGARACLTDPAGAPEAEAAGLATYVVDDPRAVLGGLAAWIYGEPATALTTIGVTGTNGKTTTTYLLEAGLRAAGHATGLVGTIATRIGDDVVPSVRTTPESTELQALLAVMRERGVDSVAMEVSSHALALGRVDGIVFDVAVFTNLTEDHLDFHRDLESYFLAKAALFTARRARAAVIDVDDAHGARLVAMARAEGLSVQTVSPSGENDADWSVEERGPDGVGTRFVLRGSTHTVEAGTGLAGPFNVDNAALAVVALHATGIDLTLAADGVRRCPGVPGRMERVDAPFTALVDYAHSPDALERALAAARPLVSDGGRLLLVIGAGGDRDPYKRGPMGEIAARLADRVILTSDNPRSEDPQAILDALSAGASALDGAAAVHVDADRRRAITRAVELARPGDVLLVAGKGHETGQEVDGVIHPFDDRVVLAEAVAAKGRLSR